MRYLKIVIALLSLLAVIIFLSSKSDDEKLSSKPLIITSNFAIYDVVSHIGCDAIELVNILPFGVDPHSFEPTPKSIAKLEKSKIFFSSGDVLEPWTEHLANNINSIDISKYVNLLEMDGDKDREEHEHHEHHHHGAYDPHYWLDIDNMKKIAQVVTAKLSSLDPIHKQIFEKNKKEYITDLNALDDIYKEVLLSCKHNKIIVTHNAFSYMAQRYGFEVSSLSGLSSDAQPSATDVKQIFKEIQEQNIQLVFFENFSNNKIITTIADDLSIEVDSLQPLGNITADECDQNLSYIKVMKLNLQKLSKAMQCN